MAKLIEFTKKKTQNLTWGQALQAFLDNADKKSLDTPIRNLVIITDGEETYTFGILNHIEVRSLMGSMDCVKQLMMENLIGGYDEITDEDEEDDTE